MCIYLAFFCVCWVTVTVMSIVKIVIQTINSYGSTSIRNDWVKAIDLPQRPIRPLVRAAHSGGEGTFLSCTEAGG